MKKKSAIIAFLILLCTVTCFAQVTSIAYPAKNIFYVNTPIPALAPMVTGGGPAVFSVNPKLPAGLNFDPATGTITGTPIDTSLAAVYTVTATSGGGQQAAPIQCSLSLTVNNASLPNIAYNASNTFTINTAIPPLSPSITGGLVGSIHDYTLVAPAALPNGLVLDANTGIITGVPTTTSENTNYVISANTPTGRKYANVKMGVALFNTYLPSVVDFTVDSAIKPIKPANPIQNVFYTIQGGLPDNSSDYRKTARNAKNQLPDGLRLNSATGEISGTPTRAWPRTIYIIVATDSITIDPIIPPKVTKYRVSIKVDPQPDSVATAPTLSFVGQGDIQQSLNSGAAIAANTGIGVIYRQNSSRRYGILHNIEVDFSINVASTVDTIKPVYKSGMITNHADYGTSVLLPSNSGQAFSFNFKGYFTQQGGKNGNYRRNAAAWSLGGVLSGFNISLNGSNSNWTYFADSTGTNPTNFKTSLVSFYAGPFFEFITPTKANGYGQNASVTLGVGYSGRWILGDVSDVQQADTKMLLGGKQYQNSFNGAEITLGLRFYNIKAEVHLPFFSSKAGIPGISGSHLTTFIGFSGGFPIDLTKPTSQ